MPLVVYISFSAAVILQINSMGWVAGRWGRMGGREVGAGGGPKAGCAFSM